MEWLIPWHPIDDPARATHGERELERELAESHPMFGLPIKALGFRQDCDDWLFSIEDGSGRVAAVHLTYTHHPPDRPPCPDARFYSSMEAWIEKEMREDNLDFTFGDDETSDLD